MDKRPTAELKALEAELFSFYGSTADKPLLYSDVSEHIGDHGIIKWEDNGQLYRVEVLEEISGNEVKKHPTSDFTLDYILNFLFL